MTRFIALLRGINVGGRTTIKMAELRDACTGLGWDRVQTYIASGNVIFEAEGGIAALEEQLETALLARFGIIVPVIVRAGADWPGYAAGNPFPDAAEAEPNRLMMMLSKTPPRADALDELRERARDGERIAQAGQAIWIHYPAGAGTSRLSPTIIDRLIGSPATARNWRTVVKLQGLLTGES